MPSTSTPAAAASAGSTAVLRPIEEVILAGTDVSVVNHTTLSLWHFQQLALQLLPSETSTANTDVEADDADDPAGDADAQDSKDDGDKPRAMELGEGMSVAAILYGRDGDDAAEEASEAAYGPETAVAGYVTPATRVAAVFKRYRCVICLDASPSTLSIDPTTGRLFLDLLYETVELFVWSLLRPMEVGGGVFKPELHVSVLVQGALVESLCMLLQGYIVTPENAATFLQLVKQRIQLIEDDWAAQSQQTGEWGCVGGATPACLDWILQNAVFALHSLPTDSAPMLVLVSDGVVDLRDAYSYDNLLMQLVRHDIKCHFLRVGGTGDDDPNASFGFVPDTQLLRFIADSTGGAVLDYVAVHEACYGTTSASSNRLKLMTDLQNACFVRKSSVNAISAPVVKLDDMDCTSFDARTLLPLRPYRVWREKVHEYRIFADVDRIVEARLREGFVINKVHIKTFQQPAETEGGAVPRKEDELAVSAESGSATAVASAATGSSGDSRSREVTKILVVFLLQWKQNVWLEYVVSTTMESAASTEATVNITPQGGRRLSGQGVKAPLSSTSKKPAAIFAKDQSTKWSEWYVKMNILAYADFLRAFEDSRQRSSGGGESSAESRGGASQPNGSGPPMGSPFFVHDFIRNVQDVDRVLLHLMTATASIADASESVASQFSFGTSGGSSSVAPVSPQHMSSHPVFNIIGELSTVLWHRWFFVERFELLCVVKNDECKDLFYRSEDQGMADRGSSVSHMRGNLGHASQAFPSSHGVNVYGTSGGNSSNSSSTFIGVESLVEPLVATLLKWSSQKLSQDLFLKFLSPATADKSHIPPRVKASGSSSSLLPGGIVHRRRQRGQNNSLLEEAGSSASHPSSSGDESKASLCFVRIELKSKTLCAVHVAFFATGAAVRRQVLHDLKSTIFGGINDVTMTPTPSSLLATPVAAEMPVILCHRMLSRLLVAHETLLLHGLDQEPGPFDRYVASPALEAEQNAGEISPANVCCGGSELQLLRVFGAYVWHASWKWEVPNPSALLTVMRRLHEARISCGFWVLDWKMAEEDDGQGIHVESVVFGREILMEDEKGRVKTALLQYALRRVSETCLMTSFWMEPQTGVVKSRLAEDVDHKDKFHWSLKQAIGHTTPFEDHDGRRHRRSSFGSVARGGGDRTAAVGSGSNSSVEKELHSMEQEDVSIDWTDGPAFLDEIDLLQLIRDYLFKSDRHFLSCLYTFDSVLNLRESIELLSQLSKDVEGVVGSNWPSDRRMAAENGMILPPFSTARLLGTSKRSTEHFLMYLESENASSMREEDSQSVATTPAVSPANEHLYSMLERTLRGLSDCEVSWTDYNGDVVTNNPSTTTRADSINDGRVFRKGMDGQLPLWLKTHLAISFKDRVPHHALSKGKCFAKLVSDDCVVLAFFPSLDTLQVQRKGTGKTVTSKMANDVSAQLEDKLKWSVKNSEKKSDGHKPVQQFSALAAAEDGSDSQVVRMSASADDIVLYQERRRSFREGYKSWRMGHYQGSRDEKKSYGRDFQKLRLTSTPEDHEFCEELSRQATYGCDFHLLIEDGGGVLGSGFFQVAFYECSISRLSTNVDDMGDETLKRVDLPQTILKQLFFSNSPSKPKDQRPTTPLDRSGRWKKSPSGTQALLNSSSTQFTRQAHDSSSISSGRFRKKVKRAHEHNFSRGVYIALREGGAVQQSDLLQALSSCLEVPVDVDITLLYRMMEAAAAPDRSTPLSPSAAAVASTGIGADILKDKLTKSFEKILSSVFVPIPGTKYYYYTGNENTAYEDFSEGEYDLHFLMEDSDDVEGGTVDRHGDDGVAGVGEGAKEEDPRARFSRSAGESTQAAARRRSSLGKTSAFKQDSGVYVDDRHGNDGSGRNESSARGLPPPVLTSNQDDSSGEQQHASVEEDAEFNKEVAVATSSFSVPFFFRFECRVLNGPRGSLTSVNETEVPPNPELMLRSSSNVSYVDLRKHMIAKSHAEGQMTSSGARQKEFDAFLASLKGNRGVSQEAADTADVTNIAEWFSKAPSGRIALRLVTLTLPNERAFDGVLPASQMPFEMDDGSGQTLKHNSLPSTRSHNFSNLHLFQRQVLTRARKDIKEWSSMEILSILKSTNKITPAIGALVQRLFEDLPAHCVTKAKYPLDFVGYNQETQVNPLDLFKRELEKGELLNIHHCNGVYFVVKKDPTEEASIRATADDNSEAKVDSGVDDAEPCFDIPYWAFFELGSDHISLCLHHPDRLLAPEEAINRLTVLTELQLGVRALCRRVNQFLLLLQLHETRTCNGLLLPPNGNYVSSPRSPKRRNSATSFVDASEGRDGQAKPKSFFWPGQFECDLRYSSFFKLHERLAPNFALNMLCTSALEQFQVHNRRHIFVYRDRDGHVFYMKISIHYEAGVAPMPLSSPVSRGPATEERHDRARFSRQSTGGSTSSSTSASTSTLTPTGVPGILLEVFGVSEAGEEVTHELCRLLERKLDEATQVMLMKLLARNAKFQLSQNDLAFLCPPTVAPASMVDYVLPSKVVECSTLLHFLSQSLKGAPYIRPVANGGRNGSHSTLRGGRRGSFASVAPPRVPEGDESLRREQTTSEKKDHAQEKEVQPGVAAGDGSCVHPACFGDYKKAVAASQSSGEQPWLGYDAAVLSPIYFSTVPLPGAVVQSEGALEVATTGASVDGERSVRAAVPSPLPELVTQASYVLNLNPDLRLSPGFLSRVGKGLALMRVDLVRNCPVEAASKDEDAKEEPGEAPTSTRRVKCLQDIPGLASLSPDGSKALTSGTAPLVARCQVWLRGGINAEELSQVVETFLEEALYDYHIETLIRELQASNTPTGHPDDTSSADSDESGGDLRLDALGPLGRQSKLPAEVDTLVSLLENASMLPSSSVMKLGLDLPISPWDLGNAVAQMRSFLCCLPAHLRPKVYAKPKPTDTFMSYEGRSDAIRVATTAWRQRLDGSGEPPLHFFRLIVKHTDSSNRYGDDDSSDSEAETATSMSSATHHIEPLMRADSIHSEISDLDSVSGRLPPTWASVGGSESNLASSQVLSTPSVASTSSSAIGALAGPSPSLQMPYMPRSLSFSESDVLLYGNSSSHHHHRGASASSREQLGSRRSFYYVLDVSANAGVQLYGYNMSSSLVEALATHMARVLTWSVLRSKLLESLLLEKTGLGPAAPVGSMVLQPRSLLLPGGSSRRDAARAGPGVGKNVAVLCKDSAVHFIEYWAPALSILQSNDVFPKVLDGSRLRSIEGTALGTYLREAHTQPASEALDHQRPRGKSTASLGAPVASTGIPDLSREASGHSSQWSVHSATDTTSGATGGVMLGPVHSTSKSGGILSGGLKPDKTSVSPTKRVGGAFGGARAAAPRLGGAGGAATALMAARARARGGGFPGRLGAGPGIGASRGGSSTASSGGENVAPWDLPLSNVKAPRLLAASGSAAESTASVASSSSLGGRSSVAMRAAKTVTSTATTTVTTPARSSSYGARRGGRSTGKSERRMSTASTSVGASESTAPSQASVGALPPDAGRINSSWKRRLECAWGPRFLFPGNTDRWAPTATLTSVGVTREHLEELEADEEDEATPRKTRSPLRFFCAALDKRWEAFEARSTSHTVALNLLEKLTTLRGGEEMAEPVASDVVAHLAASGHLVLHERFRVAFVERWAAAEAVATTEDVPGGRLRALQSCMDLVNLLSYKREFVFDGDDCAVAELYTQHTVRSMGGDVGDAVQTLEQHVDTNLPRLRLQVAREFFHEYAQHLCALGFRRLRTLSHAHSQTRGLGLTRAAEDQATSFSEFFFRSERATAEAGGWEPGRLDADEPEDALVLLEVRCDLHGVRLSAVVVGARDVEQQDLRFQHRLASRRPQGERRGVCGRRVRSVATWLRTRLQTRALIYGFSLRGVQQTLLRWLRGAQSGRARVQHSEQQTFEDEQEAHDGEMEPSGAREHAATWQNVVKGLQCLLHAFPVAPDALEKRVETSQPAREAPSDVQSGKTTSRGRLRGVRAPRRAPKAAPPREQRLRWRDCVVRTLAVPLEPSALRANCFEPLLVHLLLRYVACHGARYQVLDLLQFGTPDAVVAHCASGSFFHRPPQSPARATDASSRSERTVLDVQGYSLVITTQPLARRPLARDCVQLVLLKSAASASAQGVGNGVLAPERALQEAQLFVRELFRVAAQHYERDLLWARLLVDEARGPGAAVARALALAPELFRVDVGPQQLEECLRLSLCTPLEALDPRLDELLRVAGVCWQELALRLRDIYADQLREFQFQEDAERSSHMLLLCPDTFDIIIHLVFVTPKDKARARSASHSDGASASGSGSMSEILSESMSESESAGDALSLEETGRGELRVEICRREEPPNQQFSFAQRRAIAEFVNSIVHWQWRSLIYD